MTATVAAFVFCGLAAVVAVAALATVALRRPRSRLFTRHGWLAVDPAGIRLIRDGRDHVIYRARFDNGEW